MLRLTVRTCLCAAIAFLVLEVCARIDDYASYGAPVFAKSYNENRLYQFDRIGRRGRPYARYRKWQMNSLGYRGPELIPGRTRILCLGASETFGLYEPEGMEYPRQLERALNAAAGREAVQVVNAAIAGMPISVMAIRIPEMVRQVSPRVALIYPSPANYIWLPELEPVTRPPDERFEWRLGEHVKTLSKRLLPERLQTWMREMDIQREARRYGTVMDRVPEENVARFRDDLVKLIGALRGAGVEPVLVTHATRFGPSLKPQDWQYLVAWRRFYPMLTETGILDMERRMNAVVRGLAAGQGVVLIDAANRMPPGDENFADFVHFTEAGSRRMAALLAEGLPPVNLAQRR